MILSVDSISTFLLQVMVELPYVFLQAEVYGVIAFSMMGFEWTAAKFFWYLFFYVLHIIVLNFLWHDVCSYDTKPRHCYNSFHCVLCIMEPFFRIYNPKNCEYLPHVQSLSYSHISFSSHISSWSKTEDSYMVGMVLLGMSSGLYLVWIGCFTIWRCKRHT